jgi:hypothetical protein
MMTKVEALMLADVKTETALFSIREGRDGEEGLVVAVISASGSFLGRGL